MGSSFFDFQEKLSRKPAPPAPTVATKSPAANAITVTQLTQQIEKALKTNMPSALLVRGEVSNYKHHGSSGHAYFTLKDPDACIDCVMFKTERAALKFQPADGMELIVTGRVAVYPQRGRYQLYVSQLTPLGVGALELAFKQLHAKLKNEGLFSPDRKRPIPKFPQRIAIVTSKETAALQDILKVLRRFPWLNLSIYHTPVQGAGSAAKISAAIDHLNHPSDTTSPHGGAERSGAARPRQPFDVLLLARGGGSLEDLWEFNEEPVARAIARSAIPVVTGIGHEIDVAIADLVADHHAHTPTEAAQVITAHWRTARDTVDTSGVRLRRALQATAQDARHRLDRIERDEFFRRPLDRVNRLRQRLDEDQRSLAIAMQDRLRLIDRRVSDMRSRLECHGPATLVSRLKDRLARLAVKLADKHPRHRIALANQQLASVERQLAHSTKCELDRHRQRLDAKSTHLQAIGPEQVLRRGYTITLLKKGNTVVKSAAQIHTGDRLLTRFADGQVESTAEDPNQPGLFE